jgi:uncharacterized protein YgiM (DUF1202 family)
MRPRFKWSILAVFILALTVFTPSAFAQRAVFAAPLLVVNTSFLNVRTGPGVQYTVLVTVVGGTELPVLGVANDNVWYQVATDGGPGWVNVEFTLARGDFTNVPEVEVGEVGGFGTTANLGQGGGGTATIPTTTVTTSGIRFTGVSIPGGDLYTQPTTESIAVRRALNNDPNTILPLLGTTVDRNNITWYLVNVPQVGLGWTIQVLFRPLACGTDVVGVTKFEAPIKFDGISTQDSYLVPEASEWYLRGFNGPFTIVEDATGMRGLIETGALTPRSSEIVSVCDQIPASIANPNAGLGQGGGAIVQPVVPTLATNRVIVNTGFLNIRSGPSAGFSVIATASGGTELEVVGRAEDNVWFLVSGSFGQGWVNNQFTIFRGTYDTVPVISDVNIANFIISAPAIPASALGQGGGGVVTPINVAPNAISSGIRFTGISIPGGDLYTQPTTESIAVRRALNNDPNTILPLLGTFVDRNNITWYQVNVPEVGLGWTIQVLFRPLACGTDVVGVTKFEVPIKFDGISTRQSYLVPEASEWYLRGFNGPFTIVEDATGLVGLIETGAIEPRSSEIVSVCNNLPVTTSGVVPVTGVVGQPVITQPISIVTGNRVVVNTGSLNIRSGPSAGFSPVTTVAGGTELAVIGRATDGVWFLVQGTFGRGWVNNQFVIFRGDYSTVPVIDF